MYVVTRGTRSHKKSCDLGISNNRFCEGNTRRFRSIYYPQVSLYLEGRRTWAKT